MQRIAEGSGGIKPHLALRPDYPIIAEPQQQQEETRPAPMRFGEDSIIHLASSVFQKPRITASPRCITFPQVFNIGEGLSFRILAHQQPHTAMPRVDDAGNKRLSIRHLPHLLDLCTFNASSTEPSETQMQPHQHGILALVNNKAVPTFTNMYRDIRHSHTCRTVRKPPTISNVARMKEGILSLPCSQPSTCIPE